MREELNIDNYLKLLQGADIFIERDLNKLFKKLLEFLGFQGISESQAKGWRSVNAVPKNIIRPTKVPTFKIDENCFIEKFREEVDDFREDLIKAFIHTALFQFIEWKKLKSQKPKPFEDDLLVKAHLILFLRLIKLPLSPELGKVLPLIVKHSEIKWLLNPESDDVPYSPSEQMLITLNNIFRDCRYDITDVCDVSIANKLNLMLERINTEIIESNERFSNELSYKKIMRFYDSLRKIVCPSEFEQTFFSPFSLSDSVLYSHYNSILEDMRLYGIK